MRIQLSSLLSTVARGQASNVGGQCRISTSETRHQAAPAAQYYEEEQVAMQDTVKTIIDNDINPHVDEWEASGQYPAKQVVNQIFFTYPGFQGLEKAKS